MLARVDAHGRTLALAIVDATLIDGTGSPPVPRSVVLVGEDGRIAAAGPRGAVPVPDGIATVSGTGLTVLPGLIDGHVHLTWDKTIYTAGSARDYQRRLKGRDPARDLARAAGNAQRALAAGVTTVRDCGADDFFVLGLRDAVSSGDLTGPRILACGKPITTTAGHIYSDWGVDSAEEARKAVRLVASRGADFVKLVVSGGTTTPGTNISRAQYGIHEVRAVVEDAHRLGLAVAGHCISTDSIRIAAEAGIDTIEHCSWIGEDPRTTVTDPAAVEAMVRHGTRVDHAIIPRPYLFPEEGHAELSAEESWWLAMLRVRWPYLATMREAGVTVFLGTDACFGPWPGTASWPGFQDMARAVEIMVRYAGFAPLEALGLATGESAKALGLGDEIGTIAAGKRADLLLVRGNPVEDIRALRAAFRVYRDGRLVAEEGKLS